MKFVINQQGYKQIINQETCPIAVKGYKKVTWIIETLKIKMGNPKISWKHIELRFKYTRYFLLLT